MATLSLVQMTKMLQLLLPTPPTDEQDEHISVPVVIGKYSILKVSLVPGQGSYAQC